MRPDTQTSVTTPGVDHLLRRALEQTLLPSPNVVELAPGRMAGFVGRVCAEQDDVAELFHVNSRLARHRPDHRLSEAERAGVRTWFFDTCGRHDPADLSPGPDAVRRPHAALPAPLAAVCGAFGAGGRLTPLLYSCDLMVLTAGALCRQQPGEDALWIEMHAGGPQALAPMVPDEPAAGALRLADAAFLITAVPWRTMLGHGPRGYRRMLLDTGVLLDVLGGLAQQAGLEATPILDFYDDEVDTLLHCDGLERSVLAIVAARLPLRDRPSSNGSPR
jgi:hypothetical protein